MSLLMALQGFKIKLKFHMMDGRVLNGAADAPATFLINLI